jgi:hypothetical protein
MRVGVLSPNVLLNVDDVNAMYEDPDRGWRFDSIAKRASLLFDKVYLTQDLDATCTLLESVDGDSDSNPYSTTLRYLAEQGFILLPKDLGYTSADDFLKSNIVGTVAEINRELLSIGNPGIEGDEDELIGQPDVGDFAAHDGWHPRARRSLTIGDQRRMYESLLLRRNAALLRQAGLSDVAVVGRLYHEPQNIEHQSPLWKVVISEMPLLDSHASWPDVLDFRMEDRTQHLARSLRRWARKIVSESWTEGELQDEIRELLYEYENHLRIARMGANRGVLEFLITGTADLIEDIMKLRLGRIGKLASVLRERKVKLLQEEAHAPGRELALLSELKNHGS